MKCCKEEWGVRYWYWKERVVRLGGKMEEVFDGVQHLTNVCGEGKRVWFYLCCETLGGKEDLRREQGCKVVKRICCERWSVRGEREKCKVVKYVLFGDWFW